MTSKLTYFNMRGIAEPIRFLLAYSKIDYEDNRIDREQWNVLKPNCGEPKWLYEFSKERVGGATPFGKVPILEIDGKIINQATPICRYLAKKTDLAGSDDWESLRVDIAVENMRDIQQALLTYHIAEESAKPKLLETLTNETLPFYMGKLESMVNENNGYFVNGKLTWADVFFAAIIDSLSYWGKFNLERFSGLQELKDKVYAIPQIKSWVELRPNTVM